MIFVSHWQLLFETAYFAKKSLILALKIKMKSHFKMWKLHSFATS
ncbi:hypothetical protein LX77_00988 [Gelidibacter algens]|uniref:Uncharacterized protein n=1 Tax=Gelidibacter algens TaxID=49280 RepID=A0A327SGE8_9FLAO|nr:hypothetical protein LX77_00988 [Gelidibacter algens]